MYTADGATVVIISSSKYDCSSPQPDRVTGNNLLALVELIDPTAHGEEQKEINPREYSLISWLNIAIKVRVFNDFT